MKPMQLRLSDELHAQLKETAHVLDMSMHQFILDAIKEYLPDLRHDYRPTGVNGMRFCERCKETEADPNVPCQGQLTTRGAES